MTDEVQNSSSEFRQTAPCTLKNQHSRTTIARRNSDSAAWVGRGQRWVTWVTLLPANLKANIQSAGDSEQNLHGCVWAWGEEEEEEGDKEEEEEERDKEKVEGNEDEEEEGNGDEDE
ncbi:hypothetical protein Pmani_029488 [Petrolisthes manimaculis]|uniref:Uncharacterized protein n=1 Tax=Petrolisthes manimaculis TaxID=1843537 RepID=A0AAE1TUK3_9EUCA|nr:hypothetical protein Pmani_029488 [Petrolisthes manimaculis]